MATPGQEKPYRVYRGGRVKGKVPTIPKPGREQKPDGGGRFKYSGPGAKTHRPGRWSRKRIVIVTVVSLLVLTFVWMLAGYLAFRSGVSAANKRLPASAKTALTADKGMLLMHSTVVLMLGTDHSTHASRAYDRRSDSMTLMRTEPNHHRLYYLSIPRDLRVPNIPGHGPDKINAAFQIGGARLAARTVAEYTGLPVNHVVIVDFNSFASLIDKLGGIDIVVPEEILSNRFDCPYATNARCAHWQGWRFHKGKQHMSGRTALIYSRVRENRLNPRDSDITRGARQQQVLQTVMNKLASVSTVLKLPFIGGDLLRPLATDLSAGQFLQIGWLKKRAGKTIRCRLGGSSTGSYITPSEDNPNVLLMFQGKSAPQPPAPSNDTYPPGCYVNRLPPTQ
ncbi:MAG: LCP family protein [Actinomycetota bacterium]|nr:LCP family protein [Actinomycetota bacterium]